MNYNIVLCLLAMYSLSFFIKETPGPFDLMSRLRNLLMINKYVGVFFYKLFSCYYCIGCYSGLIIYLLTNNNCNIKECLIWMLAGGAVSFVINIIVERINKDDGFPNNL